MQQHNNNDEKQGTNNVTTIDEQPTPPLLVHHTHTDHSSMMLIEYHFLHYITSWCVVGICISSTIIIYISIMSNLQGSSEGRVPNYSLFYFVGIILVIFYIVILKLLSSTYTSRRLALKGLER